MMGSFALAGLCGTAVFFMLVFLVALLKEATRPRVRRIVARKVAVATPVSIDQGSVKWEQAA